jgi:hypothetical protein
VPCPSGSSWGMAPVATSEVESLRAVLRALILRLMLVSHAPVSRMDAMPRTRGTPDHRRPSGEGAPAWERFAREFERCETPADLIALGNRVTEELVSSTRRRLAPSTIESAEDLAERIVRDGAGWEVGDVVQAMRCTATMVRRARLAAGRDPETGYTPPDADPMSVALELRAGGRSLRTIAALTGIPRETLRRRFS